MGTDQGAGILPYCKITENGSSKVLFLFHKTFQGKKVGYLIDFGGHQEDNEPSSFAAAREFSEETCGLFYLQTKYDQSQLKNQIQEILQTVKDEHEQQQLEIIKEATLWMKQRLDFGNGTFKTECVAYWGTYHLFLTEVNWIDPQLLDEAFDTKNGAHTAIKKRKFVWVDCKDVLDGNTELPLYDRVKDSKNLLNIVADIQHSQ